MHVLKSADLGQLCGPAVQDHSDGLSDVIGLLYV